MPETSCKDCGTGQGKFGCPGCEGLLCEGCAREAVTDAVGNAICGGCSAPTHYTPPDSHEPPFDGLPVEPVPELPAFDPHAYSILALTQEVTDEPDASVDGAEVEVEPEEPAEEVTE